MFAIGGEIQNWRSEDHKQLFVEGTVRNTGSRTSREVKVRVEGRDANDVPLARAEDLPMPQDIPPDTEARYLVRLPNDPGIRTFHVEAIGH